MLDTLALQFDSLTNPDPITIPVDQLPPTWQGPAALVGLVIMIVGRVAYGMHSGKNFFEALASAIFMGNNQKKLPMWIVIFISATIIGCNVTGGVTKVTRERDKTCVEGQASFDSDIKLNEDSILQAWSNRLAKYLYIKHLADTGTVQHYGWGVCIPDTIFQNKSLGDSFSN